MKHRRSEAAGRSRPPQSEDAFQATTRECREFMEKSTGIGQNYSTRSLPIVDVPRHSRLRCRLRRRIFTMTVELLELALGKVSLASTCDSRFLCTVSCIFGDTFEHSTLCLNCRNIATFPYPLPAERRLYAKRHDGCVQVSMNTLTARSRTDSPLTISLSLLLSALTAFALLQLACAMTSSMSLSSMPVVSTSPSSSSSSSGAAAAGVSAAAGALPLSADVGAALVCCSAAASCCAADA